MAIIGMMMIVTIVLALFLVSGALWLLQVPLTSTAGTCCR